jgi:hypothetical protein
MALNRSASGGKKDSLFSDTPQTFASLRIPELAL